MRKEIWRRGEWSVSYRTAEEACPCGSPNGPIFVVMRGESSRECWHPKRFFRRNRTTTECVALALAYITERELAARRAENEAELAREEAEALAEFASDMSTELPA